MNQRFCTEFGYDIGLCCLSVEPVFVDGVLAALLGHIVALLLLLRCIRSCVRPAVLLTG